MWWWSVFAAASAVPLERLSTGHLVVDVEVAGHSRRFLLDTGASVVTLSPALAAAVGIPPEAGRHARAHTSNGATPVRVVSLAGVSIAGVDLTDAWGAVLDLGPLLGAVDPTLREEFAQVEGVLGRDFLLRADVTLDFDAAELQVSGPGEAGVAAATCVPFQFRAGLITARSRIGGRSARALIDLGANGGLVSARLAAGGTATDGAGVAIGAEGRSVEIREVWFTDVALGGVPLGPLALNVCAEGVSGPACLRGRRAVLGVDALGERTVTLSYARRALCLHADEERPG